MYWSPNYYCFWQMWRPLTAAPRHRSREYITFGAMVVQIGNTIPCLCHINLFSVSHVYNVNLLTMFDIVQKATTA